MPADSINMMSLFFMALNLISLLTAIEGFGFWKHAVIGYVIFWEIKPGNIFLKIFYYYCYSIINQIIT